MEMELLIVVLIAIFIDLTMGELPSAIHPVVLMGRSIEKIKNNFITNSRYKNRSIGILMTLFLILLFSTVFSTILYFSGINYVLFLFVASILLSTTFSIKYLLKSVYNVYHSLNVDLDHGRKEVSFLVSRKTDNLSLSEVISAAIETLTENITDSVIAPIFYVFIFGILAAFLEVWGYSFSLLNIFSSIQLPIVIGVVAGVSYRVVNTLDAMVGYKDEENIDIGWFAAKTDDYLNYIPARLTGFLVVLSSFIIRSNPKKAWKHMIHDAHNTPSPNSGYPMAAAAGALEVQLKKPETYTLGEKINNLTPVKIIEAIKLSIVTISLFLIIIIIIIVLL